MPEVSLLVERFVEVLGRSVWLRPGTSDGQVFVETFDGRFHVPPSWMPVPSSVLDLGANVGLVAAHYGVLWPGARIVCVEPDPGSALLAARNSGRLVDVCAVAGWSGTGELVGDQAYARRLVRDSGGGVVVRSLGELVDAHFGGWVDLVKMDVEGAEWDLLGDEAMVGVGAVLVELHDLEGESDDDLIFSARALLESRGFVTERHDVHPRAVFAWRP